MTITITNAELDTIKLQVRVGDQEPAESNPNLIYNGNLGADASTGPLNFDVFLFWRIADNPASPGTWSSWNQVFTDIDPVITV